MTLGPKGAKGREPKSAAAGRSQAGLQPWEGRGSVVE